MASSRKVDRSEDGASSGGDPRPCVAISGASGLVGSALAAHLTASGHRVVRLVRHEPRAERDEIGFDPVQGRIEAEKLKTVDVIVHLAGENVAAGRWNERRKRHIRDSRVLGTRLISETVAALDCRPRTLISASAIGFYGDRADETLDEDSEPGSGFLPETCVAWEAATAAAELAGLRVVKLRIGVVLSKAGGALGRMLAPFRMGLGGRIGDGKQWVSWISVRDLIRVIEFSLSCEGLRGPVNAVGPEPVDNAELTRALSHVLRRPALVPLPAWLVRRLFGQMGEELLLSSTRVLPQRLEQFGFRFDHPTIEAALRFELGRGA
jgi:uncharacterized protein (TIGR01777 family)